MRVAKSKARPQCLFARPEAAPGRSAAQPGPHSWARLNHELLAAGSHWPSHSCPQRTPNGWWVPTHRQPQSESRATGMGDAADAPDEDWAPVGRRAALRATTSIRGTPGREPTYAPNRPLCLACEGAHRQQMAEGRWSPRREDKDRVHSDLLTLPRGGAWGAGKPSPAPTQFCLRVPGFSCCRGPGGFRLGILGPRVKTQTGS